MLSWTTFLVIIDRATVSIMVTQVNFLLNENNPPLREQLAT